MEPSHSIFQCFVKPCNHYESAGELLKIRGAPTLDRILTVFEERLAQLAERKEVPRAVRNIPRLLEYNEKSLSTNEDLCAEIDRIHRIGVSIPVFDIPYERDQLFANSTFDNPYCCRPEFSSIDGPYDDQLDVLDRGSILPQTEIFRTITFVNNGPVAWPAHLQCHSTLTQQIGSRIGRYIDGTTEQLPIDCKEAIPPGGKLEVVLHFIAPADYSRYYKSLQLYTDQGVPFGRKAELYFSVDRLDHIYELIAARNKKKIEVLMHRKDRQRIASRLTRIPPALNEDNLLLTNDLTSLKAKADSKPSEALDAKIECIPFENDSLHPHLYALYYSHTELQRSIKITNTGTMAWLPGVCLKQTFTHRHTNEKIVEYPLLFKPEILPKEDVEGITLQIKTPSAFGPYILELQCETKEGLQFGKTLYFPMHVIDAPSEQELHAIGFEEKRAHLTRLGFEKRVAEGALLKHGRDLNETLEALLTEY